MSWLLGFIGSKVGKLVSMTLAAVAVVGAVFVAGRRDANKDHEIDWLQDFVDDQERINDVETHTTVPAALERLRRNGQLRD
jgi:hypothetical protein